MFKITILVTDYLLKNKIMTFLGFYFILLLILKSAFSIDIGLPCLWRSLFDVKCPGCGLTTAFVSLFNLDFEAAFESNWLIYLVIPAAAYFIIQDFIKHTAKYTKKKPRYTKT